jgi:conjugal transfer/entry exclusion protein|tara:strand:+ start:259 stop:639 length:381 start_codon:yes stop_codon:yes gene_type:complete
MDIIYIIGIVIGNVWFAITLLNIKKRNTELNNYVEYLSNELHNLDMQLKYYKGDVKDELSKLENAYDKIVVGMIEVSEKGTDTKLKKLETKFTSQTTSGVEVKKALDEISVLRKDLDMFIEMYRNQ